MNSEVRDALAARRKLAVLQYAQGIGNVKQACRDFGVPRSSFYEWTKGLLRGWLDRIAAQEAGREKPAVEVAGVGDGPAVEGEFDHDEAFPTMRAMAGSPR